MKLTPLADRVVLKMTEPEETIIRDVIMMELMVTIIIQEGQGMACRHSVPLSLLLEVWLLRG